MKEQTIRERVFEYTKEYIKRDRALPQEFQEPNTDFDELAKLDDEELKDIIHEMTDGECHAAIQCCLLGFRLLDTLEEDDD